MWVAKQILNSAIVATLTSMLDPEQRVHQIGFTPITSVDAGFGWQPWFCPTATFLRKLSMSVPWLACRHRPWTNAVARLYHDQFGVVDGSKFFRVETNEKRDDVPKTHSYSILLWNPFV